MEEKNQDIFSVGYFGCRRLSDLKILNKMMDSPFEYLDLYGLNPLGVKCVMFFSLSARDW
jgi:hypothetical protein